MLAAGTSQVLPASCPHSTLQMLLTHLFPVSVPDPHPHPSSD